MNPFSETCAKSCNHEPDGCALIHPKNDKVCFANNTPLVPYDQDAVRVSTTDFVCQYYVRIPYFGKITQLIGLVDNSVVVRIANLEIRKSIVPPAHVCILPIQ